MFNAYTTSSKLPKRDARFSNLTVDDTVVLPVQTSITLSYIKEDATEGTQVCKISKIGDIVTLAIPFLNSAGAVTFAFRTYNGIPAAFRPAFGTTNLDSQIQVIAATENAVDQAGKAIILANGSIRIYSNIDEVVPTLPVTVYPCLISWSVASF